jgi:PhnB protein
MTIKEIDMSTHYRRPGFRTVTPGLTVAGSDTLLDFLVRAFDARDGGIIRNADGTIMHAEIGIGDSLVEMSEARPQWPAKPSSLHLYVPDTDAVYHRAIKAGATPLTGPENAHYGDRAAAIEDPAGNHWFIATRLEGPPVPKGFHSVTPYLITRGADAIMTFMKQAFGGVEQARFTDDDGKIVHAEVRIDDSMIEISDGSEKWVPRPTCLHLYVPDADAVYKRALGAGATSVYEPVDQPYGDRESGVQDAGGNYWFISTFTAPATDAGTSA